MILEYRSGQITAQLAQTQKQLVRDVEFSLDEGKSLALIGETGSGKTMIALSVMQLLPRNVRRYGGSIRFCGKELPKGRAMRAMLGTEIVYIPQNGSEFLNPSRKVKYHLFDSLKKLGVPRAAREWEAERYLSSAGFEAPEEIMEKYPFQLSGGMAQRVTIALAACSHAKLLIADEPTNGLDPEATDQFLTLLAELFPDAGRLIITHDIAVAKLCDQSLVLCGGTMMEFGPSKTVLESPRNPYTRALISSLVANGLKETPALRGGESACPFYRRCPEATELCRDAPSVQKRGDVKWWCSAT